MDNYSKIPTHVNFASFMSLPDGDDTKRYLSALLSASGLDAVDGVEKLLDRPDHDVMFRLTVLAAGMLWWGDRMNGKLEVFLRLQTHSMRFIWETADIREGLSVEHMDQTFRGDWCRSDGAIFVCHNGIVDASLASTVGRKPVRTRCDRRSAELMLLGLVKAGAHQAIAA